MKHLSILAAGLLTLGLWSCSSEEPLSSEGRTEPGKEIDSKGDVYAKLTFQLPGTRSETTTTDGGDDPATSEAGKEVGKDYENNVDEVIVILADYDATAKQYKVVTTTSSDVILNQSESAPVFSIQFKSSELEDYVKDGGKTTNVFAICNPTSALTTALESVAPGNTTIFDQILSILADNSIDAAVKGRFLMSNALIATATLPDYQELIQKHNTQATAMDLGQVKVERVVSRFDFDPKEAADGIPANSYLIKDNVSGLNAAYIEMEGMSLFNLAKEYYLFPRMSAKEDWSDPTLCGYELPSTFVVSPNYTAKFNFGEGGAYTSDLQALYAYNFNSLPQSTTFEYTPISSLSEDDTDTSWGGNGNDYKIWRYATENTMPTKAQKRGITTGVLFRGEIKALPEKDWGTVAEGKLRPAEVLSKALASGENIYAWTNANASGDTPQVATMLGTAYDVWFYSLTHQQSNIRRDFVKAAIAGDFKVTIGGTAVALPETVTDADAAALLFPENVKVETVTVTGPAGNDVNVDHTYDKVANNRFMTYAPVKDEAGKNHYYTYYYYYNVHSQRSASKPAGKMYPMEFATVRNNVYKLAVDKVNGFGLPGDIVPPPPTDDENPEVYFKLSVKVLDWVVRINKIEF